MVDCDSCDSIPKRLRHINALRNLSLKGNRNNNEKPKDRKF